MAIGNGQGFSVKEMIETAERVTGQKIKSKIGARRVGAPDQLIVSSDKAKAVLKWNPQFADVEKVIATAWAWHKNHPNGYDD